MLTREGEDPAMSTKDTPHCLLCARTADTIPLLTMEYRNSTFRICAQHLPVLIHDPVQLTGRLPGAESMAPAEIHD